MYKRLFDIIVSVLGLVLVFPFFFGIACLIKITDQGPVFFRQERIGKDKKPFRLIKFRTMSVYGMANTSIFEPGLKSRVTPVGKVLRKTKLDELPQFLNVLWGDLTLVGPRPEIRKWTNVYPEKWAVVLSVKPGITDYASITYRNEEEILALSPDPENTYFKDILPRKLDMNIAYVNHHSIFKDLNILFLTVYVILFK